MTPTPPATVYVVARNRQQATRWLHLAVDHWTVFDAPRRRRRARRPIPRVIILTPDDRTHHGLGPGFAYIVGELCNGTPASANLREAQLTAGLLTALTYNPDIHIRRLWKTIE